MTHPAFDMLALKGRVVLVRLDLNVPMKERTVMDTERIQRSLGTLQTLIHMQARVVVMSHLGRPKGKKNLDLSLWPIALALEPFLHPAPVFFCPWSRGEEAKKAIENLKEGQVLMLENLRFHEEEEKNDLQFSKDLADLGDLYINDAFSCSHRAHASIEGITHFLPSYPGYLLLEELNHLTYALADPKYPYMAIIGGAKVSTKLALLESLVGRLSEVALVGAMAHTFLMALGYKIGKSLAEPQMLEEARKILECAHHKGCQVLLPIDHVVATAIEPGISNQVVTRGDVQEDQIILDAGPQTIQRICQELQQARTLIWNGALGMTEISPFEHATLQVARYAAERTKAGVLVSVAGGGDTVLALKQANVYENLTYISTAGGAFLEWLEGKRLPGLTALNLN